MPDEEYLIDDRPERYQMNDKIKNMSDEEFRQAFFDMFGEWPDESD